MQGLKELNITCSLGDFEPLNLIGSLGSYKGIKFLQEIACLLVWLRVRWPCSFRDEEERDIRILLEPRSVSSSLCGYPTYLGLGQLSRVAQTLAKLSSIF